MLERYNEGQDILKNDKVCHNNADSDEYATATVWLVTSSWAPAAIRLLISKIDHFENIVICCSGIFDLSPR